jgi:hypothetical protein
MLGFVREKLRLIRYYSAPRRRTILTRFVDVGLLAAIVLAAPAAWLGDAEIRREVALIERDGHFTRQPGGGTGASIIVPDLPLMPSDDVPYGEFRLKLIEQRRGWPLNSTIIQPHVRLDLNLYDQPGTQRNATLAVDSPEHAAILEALEEARRNELAGAGDGNADDEAMAAAYDALIERWGRADRSVDRRLLAWAFNVGASWIILSFAFSALAAALWVCVMIVTHNRDLARRQRRGQGLCMHCGYDLYGLDFNERCPECGAIIV